MKGRDYLGNLGINGWITIKWILKKWGVTMWIGLVLDRDQWQGIVNTFNASSLGVYLPKCSAHGF
jgi:hypothetical protein